MWSLSFTSEDDLLKHVEATIQQYGDKFYALVTGQEDAFYQMCMILPGVIEKAVTNSSANAIPKDSVIDELNDIAKSKDGPFALALYMFGFGSYAGFRTESLYDNLQGVSSFTVNERINNVKCKKCNNEFQWSNRGDIYPGGKDKEDIVCPYCGSVNDSIMTSGYIYIQK